MPRLVTAKKKSASNAVASDPKATETRARKPARKGSSASKTTPAAAAATVEVAAHSPKPIEISAAVSTPESEFMEAMQEYKRVSGRMFPTWSEVLEVLQKLGYRKAGPNEALEPVDSSVRQG